jgi:hypothetical protein
MRFGPFLDAPRGFTPICHPEGQTILAFLPSVVPEIALLTCLSPYSPCGVPFGPSITVPGSAYLWLRLSALECLNNLADCMFYYALC